MTGKFIVFEGGEGSGKSTQAKILAERLIQTGLHVVQTREPGGTTGAELIRGLLVDGSVDRWSASAELGLFMAARADHVERVIKPALEQDAWVICDRFVGSTIAYQGSAGGISIERIIQAFESIVGPFYPDITIILDIDPEVGLARKYNQAAAPSRFEKKKLEFHNAVRKAYADMPGLIFDGSVDKDRLAEGIWHYANTLLEGQK